MYIVACLAAQEAQTALDPPELVAILFCQHNYVMGTRATCAAPHLRPAEPFGAFEELACACLSLSGGPGLLVHAQGLGTSDGKRALANPSAASVHWAVYQYLNQLGTGV
jgi:hypothetical protein